MDIPALLWASETSFATNAFSFTEDNPLLRDKTVTTLPRPSPPIETTADASYHVLSTEGVTKYHEDPSSPSLPNLPPNVPFQRPLAVSVTSVPSPLGFYVIDALSGTFDWTSLPTNGARWDKLISYIQQACNARHSQAFQKKKMLTNASNDAFTQISATSTVPSVTSSSALPPFQSYFLLANGQSLLVEAHQQSSKMISQIPLSCCFVYQDHRFPCCFIYRNYDFATHFNNASSRESKDLLAHLTSSKLQSLLPEFQLEETNGFISAEEQAEIDSSVLLSSELAFKTFYNNIMEAEGLLRSSRMLSKRSSEIGNRFKCQWKAQSVSAYNILQHQRLVNDWMCNFYERIGNLYSRYKEMDKTFPVAIERLSSVELHGTLQSTERKTLMDCLPIHFIVDFERLSYRDMVSLVERVNDLKTEFEACSAQIVEEFRVEDYTRQLANLDDRLAKILGLSEKQSEMFLALCKVLPAPPIAYSSLSMQQRLKIEQSQLLALNELFLNHSNIEATADAVSVEWESSLLSAFKKVQKFFLYKKNLKEIYDHGVVCRMAFLQLEESFSLLDRVYTLPNAYAHALKEVVRRRTFHEIYSRMANLAKESLQKIRFAEIPKRAQFFNDFSNRLPKDLINGIEVLAPPHVNFDTSNLSDFLPKIESFSEPSEG